MSSDDEHLRQWIGQSETADGPDRARSAPSRCRRPWIWTEPPLQEGDPLPPLWHWLYFWTIAPRSQLGPRRPSGAGPLPAAGRHGAADVGRQPGAASPGS